VIRIEGELIVQPKAGEYGDGDAHRKAADIDERRGPVLQQVAPGDPEVVSEHGESFG